ncbi:MAG: pseudouridine synthase [Oceanospirillaceae bacterium]
MNSTAPENTLSKKEHSTEISKSNNGDDFIAPFCAQQIEILLQNEDFLIINKPSGLLSLSGKNPLNFDSVHYRLVQDFPSATLVHRLDFGTSGIMLVALNKAVNADFTKQLQNRTVVKHYIAILQGHVGKGSGSIDVPLAKGIFPRQKICYEQGKAALSEYQVLAKLDEPALTKVQFTPQTGRTHQLRLHSLAIGHPIIGCDLYNNDTSQALAPRLMLHASLLEFDHPFTGQRISVACECSF